MGCDNSHLQKLDTIVFLITRVQICLHRVRILICLLDASVCSHVVKMHILVLILAILWPFSLAKIYFLV